MNHCKGKIAKLLADYFRNDFRRITHALEVLKYAEQIKLNNGQAFNPGCEAKALEDHFPGNQPEPLDNWPPRSTLPLSWRAPGTVPAIFQLRSAREMYKKNPGIRGGGAIHGW